jgi:hypothetical protein
MGIDHLKSERLAVAGRVHWTRWLDEYPTNLIVRRRPIRKMNPAKDLFSYRPHPGIRVLDNRLRRWVTRVCTSSESALINPNLLVCLYKLDTSLGELRESL